MRIKQDDGRLSLSTTRVGLDHCASCSHHHTFSDVIVPPTTTPPTAASIKRNDEEEECRTDGNIIISSVWSSLRPDQLQYSTVQYKTKKD